MLDRTLVVLAVEELVGDKGFDGDAGVLGEGGDSQ
jgi:hypothetical protein